MAPIAGNKRKHARPSIASRLQEGTSQDAQPRKRRGRPSQKDRNELVETTGIIGDRNRQQEHDDRDSALQLQYLAAEPRGISRHIIDSKWEELPGSAVERVSQLLNDVERSVVMRLQDERKRTQASTAVQMVVRRLHRKLTRGQPFPPSTRPQPEEDFDFEKILDSSRELEARLTPMLHSIELLKAETAKEEALLEAEAATLDALEANAKAEASRRRRTEKTLHDILRDDSEVEIERLADDKDSINQKSQQHLLDVAKADDDLGPVIDQLFNHLESIQSNSQQVKGLGSMLVGSRAALQNVLFKHVGSNRYDEVVLG